MARNVEHLGIVYNPELAFRKSIAEVANKLEIASIETQGGDSSEMIVLFARSRMSRIAASFFSVRSRRPGAFSQITALVAQCRLPAIYPLRSFCEVGGLMSYGVKTDKLLADAASYADRILRGANSAELPVQAQPNLSWS